MFKHAIWWPQFFLLLIYHTEGTSGSTSQSGKDHHIEKERNNNKSLEKSNEKNDQRRSTASQYSTDVDQQAKNSIQGVNSTSAASWLREYIKKLWIVLRSQNYLPLALVITFAVIFFMQVCLFLLLLICHGVEISTPKCSSIREFASLWLAWIMLVRSWIWFPKWDLSGTLLLFYYFLSSNFTTNLW